MLRSDHLLVGALAGTMVLATSAGGQRSTPTATTRMVDVDGHSMRVRHWGLETRSRGTPVVVFEAGSTHSLDAWGGIPTQVAASAAVVAYDRNGLGQSEWDGVSPTPRHVASKLRLLLQRIGAEPPYVLVGHSWGGTLARYFAGYYPSEVAGLVYVDPGPIVTQSLADELAPFKAIGAGKAEYDSLWSIYGSLFGRSSPALRAEFDVFRGLTQREVSDRDLRPVPNVPVAVLLAAKPIALGLKVPYDPDAQFAADVRHRIKMLQEWALASPRGTLVVSNETTHAIPRDDPDLVVWAVRRVLSAATSRPSR